MATTKPAAKPAGKQAKPPVEKTTPKLTPASQKAVDMLKPTDGRDAVIRRLLKLEAEVKELKAAARMDEKAAVQAAAEKGFNDRG